MEGKDVDLEVNFKGKARLLSFSLYLKIYRGFWSLVFELYYRLTLPFNDFEGLKKRFNSVSGLADWIKGNIRYTPDPLKGIIDYSLSPELTYRRGKGDCEDIARLAYEVVRGWTDRCYLVTYFAKPFSLSHALLVFDASGILEVPLEERYAVIDSSGLLPLTFSSIREAIKYVAEATKSKPIIARVVSSRATEYLFF